MNQNKRQNISSGTIWEDIVDYSHATRIKNIIEVEDATATRSDNIIGASQSIV